MEEGGKLAIREGLQLFLNSLLVNSMFNRVGFSECHLCNVVTNICIVKGMHIHHYDNSAIPRSGSVKGGLALKSA